VHGGGIGKSAVGTSVHVTPRRNQQEFSRGRFTVIASVRGGAVAVDVARRRPADGDVRRLPENRRGYEERQNGDPRFAVVMRGGGGMIVSLLDLGSRRMTIP
ncbi:MAG: hypothetical protein LBJ59_09380, partial [Zoogloeaceae bacterium]|nr:hypothetical protein [Zoogloeaceae bacterium]